MESFVVQIDRCPTSYSVVLNTRVQRKNMSNFVVFILNARVFQKDLHVRLCKNVSGFIEASINEELKFNLQTVLDTSKTFAD